MEPFKHKPYLKAEPSAPPTPGAPVAVGGDTVATLTWTMTPTAPGDPVSFDVVSIPATTTQHFASGGTFTGLTNGVSYTFKVTAHSAAGTSAQSSASNAVTPSA